VSWRTPITLTVLLAVLLGAAFYGWQTIISPARENDKEADATPKCDNVVEFRKGDVIKPDDIVVNVYNAGTEAGLAGFTLDRMVNRGFKRGTAANAPSGIEAKNVTIITDDKSSPTVRLVARQFKGTVRFVAVDDLAPGIDIVVGNDFKGIDTSAKRTLKVKTDVSSCTSTSDAASG
jgi:hypothetical protein